MWLPLTLKLALSTAYLSLIDVVRFVRGAGPGGGSATPVDEDDGLNDPVWVGDPAST